MVELSKLYFLADHHVRSVDKLEGRYLVWAEHQQLRVGQMLHFPERNAKCSLLRVTLILGKKMDVEVTESGHRYFLDFDKSIGAIAESCNLEYYLDP